MRHKFRREYNILVQREKRATHDYNFFGSDRCYRRLAKARKDRMNYLLFIESMGYELTFGSSGQIMAISR